MSMIETAVIATALSAATMAALRHYRVRRHRALGERRKTIAHAPLCPAATSHPSGRSPAFNDRLAVLPEALSSEQFRSILGDIEKLGGTERSYVPTHKKGGTVAYETLCANAPNVVALYLSSGFHDLISGIVGERIVPTPLHDQSSCSVLYYERPGDHIGWHYDHNFYKGRHFTVLLPLINRDADGHGLSAARLWARIDGVERQIETPPNQLVVFEGAKVLHKASPIDVGERRVVLSMTFATDPRSSALQGVARRIKDTAFFGIRALWT